MIECISTSGLLGHLVLWRTFVTQETLSKGSYLRRTDGHRTALHGVVVLVCQVAESTDKTLFAGNATPHRCPRSTELQTGLQQPVTKENKH